MIHKATYLLLIIISVFFIGCTIQVQKSNNLSGEIDALFAEVNNEKSPGAAVLVVKDGKTIHSKGYGMANLEHGIPITANSVFDIASVSKQFVGFSIALLIEEDKIALNDDVKKYIPEFPDFGHTITIGHLLYHQSGLRDWVSALKLSGVQFEDAVSLKHVLEMTYRQKDLNFIPGSEYSYSNTGYNVLVEVIQRITKKPYATWTAERIFKPLEMKNTFFRSDVSKVIPKQVHSYYEADGTFHFSPNNLTAIGSSSLQTTIEDLGKWVNNLDDPKIYNKAVIERMQIRGVLTNGEETNYAFGIEVDEYRGFKRMGHDGGWASFSTYLTYLPEERLSVVVLFNRPWYPQGTAQDIIDVCLKDTFKKSEEVSEIEKDTHPPIKVSTEILDQYLGVYRLEPDVYITISREGDQLFTLATGESAQEMTPTAKDAFWVASYEASMVFNRNEFNVIKSFMYKGEEVPKMKPIHQDINDHLEEFTGVYLSEELNAGYRVIIEDGALVMSNIRNGNINLTASWEDGFQSDAWYARIVEFQRDSAGKIVAFLATQYRSRNQKFIKI